MLTLIGSVCKVGWGGGTALGNLGQWSAGMKMAAFRLLFLLLGEFEFVDRICEGGIKCLDKAGCKPYLDALEAYKQMPEL